MGVICLQVGLKEPRVSKSHTYDPRVIGEQLTTTILKFRMLGRVGMVFVYIKEVVIQSLYTVIVFSYSMRIPVRTSESNRYFGERTFTDYRRWEERERDGR